MAKTDELYAPLLANSVDGSKEGIRPLQEAAKEHGVVIVLGYQERMGESRRCGGLQAIRQHCGRPHASGKGAAHCRICT